MKAIREVIEEGIRRCRRWAQIRTARSICVQLRHLRILLVLSALPLAAHAAEPSEPSSPAEADAGAERAVPVADGATQPIAQDRAADDATRSPSPAVSRAAPAADRLDLDTTVVTGNRELPKVLYIVPWKKADIGELPAQPFNTLLDEVLTPVDRDVFRREVTYYDAVTGGADATQSTSRSRR